MRITCTRTLEFDAAHRVLNHESKCRTIHGHRYKVEVTAEAYELDSLGRVIDFSVIKSVCGEWLDLMWDHTSILHTDDPLKEAIQLDPMAMKNPYIMDCNPTAENMAKELLLKFNIMLRKYDISVIKIRIYETPNCYAEAIQ